MRVTDSLAYTILSNLQHCLMRYGSETWSELSDEARLVRGKLGLKPNSAAAAKSLQWCPTLGDPIDGSPPGSAIPGILQARTLEWVAISFSNAWKWKVKVKSLSRVQLFATPWTAAYQAPPSMGFPGKSTGVGCHCLLWILAEVKAHFPAIILP